MRAAVFHEYGPPDAVVRIAEVESPVPKEDEVLLAVRAASLNALDWHMMRGTPYFMRLMTGLLRPGTTRPGVDVAGRVEAVGAKVTDFRVGDEVLGGGRGTVAELACAQAAALIARPAGVSAEQAATLPVAGLTALQGLRDHAGLQPGQKVLVNGATGGVGTFAVQVARALGAEVTGVTSTKNLDLVRSLGAGRVVDYTREDFARDAERYDVLFDTVGNRSLRDCRRVLKPRGRHVIAGVRMGRWVKPFPRLLGTMMAAPLLAKKPVFFVARRRREDLALLLDWTQAGKLTPMIDRVHPLEEAAEAMRHLAGGHARGKIVVTVGGMPAPS